jgi:acetoacetyl-CoA synthetase
MADWGLGQGGSLVPIELGDVLWQPERDAVRASRMGRFLQHVRREHGVDAAGYRDLHAWSVRDLAGFWTLVWDFFEINGHRPDGVVVEGERMPDVRWFPGASLNYAEHAVRHRDGVAIVARSQTRPEMTLTFDELRSEVARVRTGLRRLGVRRGDRVAAYLPTIPEAMIAHLAAASLGAVWSSCPPEFGTRSVLDRFGQIEPKVMLVVDGYQYGERRVDRRDELARIREALPSVETVVTVPYPDDPGLAGAVAWADLGRDGAEPLAFEPVPFDHPLVILYSSGTSGPPKPIVHGHGGVLLEHCKALGLHYGLTPDDRFLWYTTTGWMMWNVVLSALLTGATAVLFDGNPGYPDLGELWRVAADAEVTFLGLSAGFIMSCHRAGLAPGRELDLSRLWGVGSTGSALPVLGYVWVRDAVGEDVQLVSGSGGTDVITGFVGGAPLVPVYAGEMSCPALGCDVAAFDEHGVEVVGQRGELVIRKPMPSMPVGILGDPDGTRLRETYFTRFPGVWRHGDWITITERGSSRITGRSDATLNRGGVRLGSAEFDVVVESLTWVRDSMVVHLEGSDAEARPEGRLLLFVVLGTGEQLDDERRGTIGAVVRAELSPRHVPDEIVQVAAIPRTLTGKKLEIPVKRILSGAAPESVVDRGAVTDFAALEAFAHIAGRAAGVR